MAFSIEALSQFAAGMTPLEVFRETVVGVLLHEAPRLSTDDAVSVSASFSLLAEWAMYLDMVTDPDDPSFGEDEARRLAGAMCAILDQLEDEGTQRLISPMARWAPATVDAIRKYGNGDWSRDALDRFIGRRPWPEGHRRAVAALDSYALARLGEALEANNYLRVAEILAE